MKIKRSKKRAIKYANGGQTPGLGINYAPKLPVYQYLDQARRQRDQALNEQRDKLTPNEQAAREYIDKAPGTPGQKDVIFNEATQAILDHKKKIRENPDWAFSEDARESLSKIDSILSPSRFAAMAETQKLLSSAYETMEKNNTLGQYHISNGKISVLDNESGKRRDISLSEFQRGSDKFKPLRGAEIYEMANTDSSFDPASKFIDGQMYNPSQARAELFSHFDKTGSTTTDTGLVKTSSNKGQLQSAKAQAIASLSDRSKDALIAEYIERTGSFDQDGFNKYLTGILDIEANKRGSFSQDVDINAQLKLQDVKNKMNELEAQKQPVNTAVNVHRDYTVGINVPVFGFDRDRSVHIAQHSSSPTDKKATPISINSDVYIFGQDMMDGIKGSGESGKPVRVVGSFKNASHVDDVVMPITTGQVLKLKNDGNYEILTGKVDPGAMVVKGGKMGDKIVIPEGAPMWVDPDNGYSYFNAENGYRVVVGMSGFRQYEIYDEDKVRMQAFVPMDRRQSLSAFGVNYSSEASNGNYFKSDGEILDSGLSLVSYRDQNNNLIIFDDVFRDLLTKYKENPVDKNKKIINVYLNSVKDRLVDQDLINRQKTPKESYTIRDATDDRNRED